MYLCLHIKLKVSISTIKLRTNFFAYIYSDCYNGYMVNNNNIDFNKTKITKYFDCVIPVLPWHRMRFDTSHSEPHIAPKYLIYKKKL